MARTTVAALESRIAALTSAVEALVAAQAPAPATAAPVDPFVASMRERAAARVICAVHEGCTRRFSPKSSGASTHVACTGKCPDGVRHHH